MLHKQTLYLVLMLLTISIVSADHILTYDNYYDVGETGNVTLKLTDEANETAYVVLQNTLSKLSESGDNLTKSFLVTSAIEEDVDFTIFVYRANATITNVTNADSTPELNYRVENQSYFMVKYNHTEQHFVDELHNNNICFYVKRFAGTPNVRTAILFNDSTNKRTIKYSDTISITTPSYNQYCIDASYIHTNNLSANHDEYFGIQCTNCDGTDKLDIGYDTTTPDLNASYTFTTINSTPILRTNDFMISLLSSETEVAETYSGTLKFREPYIVNISLYNEKNESLKTSFDYVYLKKIPNSNSASLSESGSALTESMYTASKILTLGAFDFDKEIDYSEVFWGVVNSDVASIKLYETGNYSITLLTVKTFKEDGWNYEFIKPQYTDSRVETTLDDKVLLDEKTPTKVKILLSEFEANKAGFIFNLIKWGVAVGILLLCFVVAVMSRSWVMVSAVVPFWIALVKLFGLV